MNRYKLIVNIESLLEGFDKSRILLDNSGDPILDNFGEIIIVGGVKWAYVDLGEDEPATTLQTNDIAELQDRQSSYTQELALPLTQHNRAVLGLPDEISSITPTPYRRLECRLYCNEYDLLPYGSSMLIDSVTDTINVQVVGPEISFFEALQNAPMSAIKEPTFLRDYTSELDPATFPANLKWVAASFTKSGFHHLAELDPRYMLPVVKDEAIMSAIIAAQGYTWERTIAGLTDKYLPVVALAPDTDSFNRLGAEASGMISTILAGRYYVPTIITNLSGLLTQVGTDSSTSLSYTQYEVIFDGKLRLAYTRTEIPLANSRAKPFNTTITLTRDTEVIDLFTPSVGVSEINLSGEFDVQKGDIIKIIILSQNQTSTPPYYDTIRDYNHQITVSNVSAEYVPLHGLVHAPMNLGFENQSDYFKGFLQRYGLMAQVDRRSKTVYTYGFDRIYANKTAAVDWTAKLHGEGRELTFEVSGYARTNNLLMADNGEDNVKDSGSFLVDDATLEAKKDLFTLPHEAGLDWASPVAGSSDKYASVPVFDVDAENEELTLLQKLTAAEYSSEGKSHLLKLLSATEALPSFAPSYGTRGYQIANHVTAQDIVDTYYSDVSSKMLVRAKGLSAKFWLKESDIAVYNPLIPIYLTQYGAYFYINKIQNFVAGKLTTVQLIRL